MKVDFNNLRRQSLKFYTDLVKELNKSLVTDTDYTRVIVPVADVQRHLDNLRNALVTIGCTYEDNDPNFECIIKEDDEEIISFNPENL